MEALRRSVEEVQGRRGSTDGTKKTTVSKRMTAATRKGV